MTWEIGFVFAVVTVAFALFVTERARVDAVALGIPVALLAAGIVSPRQAVAGFSDEATVIVAGMLILSLGLQKTGAVQLLGRWAGSAPLGGPRLRMAALCLLVAVLSAFLNNTTVVVVFLPVFMALSQQMDEPPSLWLMPLSFAAILGGTVTLIGTSTNVIVYGLARDRGYDDLTMFSIAPLGLIYLAVGMTYLLTIGYRLLPRRASAMDLSGRYAERSFVTELRVESDSPAAGKSLADLDWRARHDVTVMGLSRGDHVTYSLGGRRRIRAGDVLFVRGDTDDLLELAAREKLSTLAQRRAPGDAAAEATEAAEAARMVEILIGPRSPLAGRTLEDVRFQQRWDATVLAVQHEGRNVRGRISRARILPGDLLLVHGPPESLAAIADEPGFIPLGEVAPPAGPRPRALVALLCLIGVVVAAGTGVVGILHAVLLGVGAMLFTGSVRVEEIYAEMDWMIVFLLAGVIPLGIAMDQTGGAAWIGANLADWLGGYGPTAVVAGFYVATMVLTAVMSNAATAVVLTPIAILTAESLGMNPYALLVAIMFAASCDFLTPIGYQTNTLIYGPGGYRFSDYPRVGGILSLLLLVTASLLIPVFWPS